MKIYRLLEMIIYLLNHRFVTANELSEVFEVSQRTIQRDMDLLLSINIPIQSTVGAKGGYCIPDDFKMQNQFVKKEDFAFIIAALESLSSFSDNEQVENILNAYIAMMGNEYQPSIKIDYSISKEDKKVQSQNKLLEQAIQAHQQIRFIYHKNDTTSSYKQVNPILLRFQWYAWYLYAYDIEKSDVRMYKVSRMESIAISDHSFTPYTSSELETIIKKQEANYKTKYIHIEVLCKKEGFRLLDEYFPQEEKIILPDGNYKMNLRVPDQERIWQALLLSMGGLVQIISPCSYRQTLIDTAKNFLKNHDS